jgi:hypothetical protein
MTDLAAWGPTIVAGVTMIFTAGILVQSHRDLRRAQEDHGLRLNGLDKEVQIQAVAIAKLEAWRDGYNAATYRHVDEASQSG